MKGGANPSPFAVLSIPDSKRYLFTVGLTKSGFDLTIFSPTESH